MDHYKKGIAHIKSTSKALEILKEEISVMQPNLYLKKSEIKQNLQEISKKADLIDVLRKEIKMDEKLA